MWLISAGVVVANNSNPTPTIGTIIVTYTNPSCSFNYYPNINAQGSIATSGTVYTPAFVGSNPLVVSTFGADNYVASGRCPTGESSDYTVSYTINGKTYSISGNV